MKVKQLIAKLAKLDQELMVAVDGYEGGVHELKGNQVRVVGLFLDSTPNVSYYGEHSVTKTSKFDCKAVLLTRSP